MDGPSHLYNASLLNQYNRSSFVSGFLDRNMTLLPNLLTHIFLRGLLYLFDFLVAEKILITLIVISLPVTFRWLVLTYTRTIPYFSFLIFPLVFTNLLQLGFYNFSLGMVFFNLHLIFAAKIVEYRTSKKWWILLFLNSFPLYFCHLFGYGLALVCTGIWLIWSIKKINHSYWPTLSGFVFLHLPTLLFAGVFFSQITVPFYKYDLEPFEKTTGLITFSSAILFEKRTEMSYATLMSLLLVMLITISFVNRRGGLRTPDLFLILAAGMLYLVYHSTDGDLGGMFIQRLFVTIFYFMIIWIACTTPAIGKHTIIAFVTVLFVFFNLLYVRDKVITKIQPQVADILNARKFINENSTIYTVRRTEAWFHLHASNYLGIQKEVILFENYEASLAWFPLTWNREMLELKSSEARLLDKTNPDYIFVYGSDPKFEYRLNDTLRLYIDRHMTESYRSPDNFCVLFQRKR